MLERWQDTVLDHHNIVKEEYIVIEAFINLILVPIFAFCKWAVAIMDSEIIMFLSTCSMPWGFTVTWIICCFFWPTWHFIYFVTSARKAVYGLYSFLFVHSSPKRNIHLICLFSLVPLGHWPWHGDYIRWCPALFSKRNAASKWCVAFREECKPTCHNDNYGCIQCIQQLA